MDVGLVDRRVRYGAAIITASVLGGAFAAVFVAALHHIATVAATASRAGVVRVAILAGAGAIVGVIGRLLGPAGSVDLLLDNIHLHGGHHALRPLRSVIAMSLVCVGVGGTLGPEAPLVETNGTVATWMAVKFHLDRHDRRVVTIAGMASALAVLFGAPFGAAVFALELPHRRGMEYSEAILPACAGALVGWAVDALARSHGWAVVWSFGRLDHLGVSAIWWGAVAGVVGAGIGVVFMFGVRAARKGVDVVPRHLRPLLGGLLLGLLSLLSLDALTNGEARFEHLGRLATATILLAAAVKLGGALVASVTGWTGGFIIPLFFVGGAVGLVLARWFGVPAVFVVPGCMAATNAAVTRTPMGSALTVAEMGGMPAVAPVITATLVATVLTDGVRHFSSQRPRPPRASTAQLVDAAR